MNKNVSNEMWNTSYVCRWNYNIFTNAVPVPKHSLVHQIFRL